MGNDLSYVRNKFGLLAGLLGNISATTCGLSAKRTVAMHCRGGCTWNNLFVFDGPMEPEDRYDGMKLAFGTDTEILKPYREGPNLSHERLDAVTYNKLLVAAQNRSRSWEAFKDDKIRVTNDAVRNSRPSPIWSWAVKQKYGVIISIIYALFSLCTVPGMFIGKAWFGDARPMVLYCCLFFVMKAYVHIVLFTNRFVCYIQIAEEDTKAAQKEQETYESTSDDSGNTSIPFKNSLWRNLRDNSISTSTPSGDEAVKDIRQGDVRHVNIDGTDYLLVPVIGLQPLVGWDLSQWLLIGRRFRGPALTFSWFLEGNVNHSWSVAFAICAFVQAALQDDVARVFLADTSTYSVNWLRILDESPYPEEYKMFRQSLDWNWSWSLKDWPWLWPSKR